MYFDLFLREPIIRELKSGDALLREGDESNGEMYVVIAGEAEISVDDHVVELATAGVIIGEMTMIEAAPRAATVVAKSDCRLAVIDQKRFDFLVTQMPGFAREVMRVMAHRLRHADELLRQASPRFEFGSATVTDTGNCN